MDSLPDAIRNKCQKLFGTFILSSKPISGGDINHAQLLETNKGNFFLKFNSKPGSLEMFEKEAKGLSLLDEPAIFRIPKVLHISQTAETAFLILEYIKSGVKKRDFWEIFGRRLAQLHQTTQEHFGLDHANYIGSLVQQNHPHPSWSAFFIKERLLPQIKLARNQNRLKATDLSSFEKLFKKIPNICPNEPSALIHGDLWSGNFLIDSNGQPVLIDPAVSFAHREMDLAMTKLFGGFDSAFYSSYKAAYPLTSGFSQRMEVYQLYYLLVHVNLFGGGYVNSVRSILKKFAS